MGWGMSNYDRQLWVVCSTCMDSDLSWCCMACIRAWGSSHRHGGAGPSFAAASESTDVRVCSSPNRQLARRAPRGGWLLRWSVCKMLSGVH